MDASWECLRGSCTSLDLKGSRMPNFPVQKHGEITVSMDPPCLNMAPSFLDLSTNRPSSINKCHPNCQLICIFWTFFVGWGWGEKVKKILRSRHLQNMSPPRHRMTLSPLKVRREVPLRPACYGCCGNVMWQKEQRNIICWSTKSHAICCACRQGYRVHSPFHVGNGWEDAPYNPVDMWSKWHDKPRNQPCKRLKPRSQDLVQKPCI